MAEWLRNAVFYEIYPSSFKDSDKDGYGDFEGIISSLDYVADLGCNAIWLNPCFVSPFRDGGYDVADFFDVSPRFGDMAAFDRLVAACKERGLKLILDLVAGHASEENPDFLKSARPQRNELSDRFIWTDSPWDYPPGVHCVSGRHERYGNYVVNFFSCQPALNYGFKRVDYPSWQLPYTHEECLKTREWLKSVIRFWLRKGADGFRVDMADSLVKNDDDKSATMELWRDVKDMMNREFSGCVLISEWSCPSKSLTCGFDCDFILDHWGKGYNALFRRELTDDGGPSYFSASGGGSAAAAFEEFEEYFKFNSGGKFVSFITCNHDTPRLSALYSDEQLKIIYATLMSLPGVPFLYYGDEIGMPYQAGLSSRECGFQRTGSRTPMQWTDGLNAGFSGAEPDKLYLPVDREKRGANAAAQHSLERSLLNTTRSVIAFRRSHPQLTSDHFETVSADGYPLIFRRQDLYVCVNPLAVGASCGVRLDGESIFDIGGAATVSEGRLSMPPISFTVLQSKGD